MRAFDDTWDAEKGLVKVESRSTTPPASRRKVEWQFDALGRRIRQTTSDGSSGTWQVTEDLKFVSDPVLFGRHITELNATNNALVRSYVWGLDLSGSLDGAGGVGGLLFVTQHSTPQPSTHFVAYDGNGNVAALVKATDGSETARYEYGPFGEPLRVTCSVARENPFRFSTKRTDNTTDLVLYEYRLYNPSTGRWVSRDPIGDFGFMLLTREHQPTMAAGLHQAGATASDVEQRELIPYSFVGNDAISYIDDCGLRRARFPPKIPLPPLPPTDPRDPPMEDWPGLTVDQWNEWLLLHVNAQARRRCAKKQPPSMMPCGCCVVSVCWVEGIDTGAVSMYTTYAYVTPRSCSDVRRSFRRDGTIGESCPKRWHSAWVLLPW